LSLFACGALWEAVQARQERDVAVSRALAAYAVAELPVDSELSLLLATYADLSAKTEQSEIALRRSLVAYPGRGILREGPKEVNAVAFSSDGSMFATASEDGTVRIWTTDKQIVTEILNDDAGILGIAFSPDNSLIATAKRNRTASIWQLRSG